jgi:hypothetical protein
MKQVQQQAHKMSELNNLKVASAKKAIQQIRDKVCNKKVSVTEGENSLRELTWDFSVQLRTNIFTLELYEPEDDESSASNAESVPLLGYPVTQWVPGGRRGGQVRYTIVEPVLPAAPDCAAYSAWGMSLS